MQIWELQYTKTHRDDYFLEANTFCMGVVALKVFKLLQLFPKGTSDCSFSCLEIW